MRNYVDGGEAILQAFRCLGTDYIMASPGSEWGALWEAIAQQQVDKTPGPTYLSCAHETLAVDLAIGYTQVSGRMQAVMLHTGVGLLQGSMGIDSAFRQGIPMVVVSGESLTYGEDENFEPGPQWQSGLSVSGGTHRLIEPVVKWANQISSSYTLHQQIVRAGEMAQRAPMGPTYLTVPIETMREEWTNKPSTFRNAPPAPKLQPSVGDIERVAKLLVAADNPMIITESSGRDPAGYGALIALAEALAIPVINSSGADYSNFPKDHPLYQGFGRHPNTDEADVVLAIRARVPWYPVSKRPAQATVVAIDDAPFRPSLPYQTPLADIFLEGDAVVAMQLLTEAAKKAGIDSAKVAARQKRWAAAHDKLADELAAIVAKARDRETIAPIALAAALAENLPKNTIFADETITHRPHLMRHLGHTGPQSYFRVHGGLGQGVGVSLGLKLAAKDRPVVAVIGDGSFMYNPVLQALALSKHENIPILIVISNNNGYNAMRMEHNAYYPKGVSEEKNIFPGHPITDLEYSELPKLFGGFGRRVEKLADLAGAIKEAQAAVEAGTTAILNVVLEDVGPGGPVHHTR